ncbi:hypothetical protein NQZ68_028760, partial [Dissostichus eleginoides]
MAPFCTFAKQITVRGPSLFPCHQTLKILIDLTWKMNTTDRSTADPDGCPVLELGRYSP